MLNGMCMLLDEKKPSKSSAQIASSDTCKDTTSPGDGKIIGAILGTIWLYAQPYTVKERKSVRNAPSFHSEWNGNFQTATCRMATFPTSPSAHRSRPDRNLRIAPLFYVFQNKPASCFRARLR